MSETKVRVRYAETDAMGVVYHANYLVYFEAGRGDYMRQIGIPYREFENRGLFIPVVECTARWRAPARYEELLTVHTRVVEFSPAKITFAYRVIRDADERVLCEGQTTHAFIDFSGRPQALNKRAPDLLERLQRQIIAAEDNGAGPATR